MPGGWSTGGDNRTICRSLSRTREVRRSTNQIGIPPLVHCHKMAALNHPDSAYCSPHSSASRGTSRKTPPIDSFLPLLFFSLLYMVYTSHDLSPCVCPCCSLVRCKSSCACSSSPPAYRGKASTVPCSLINLI